MTQSALTPSSNLFDLIGPPATDNTDFQPNFNLVRIISKGDPNARWVKAVLRNGEECFLFPDDENTVQVKNYNIGAVLRAESPRPCRNPGATKWTTNALHTSFQLEQSQQLEKNQTEGVNSEITHLTSKAENAANNLLADVSSSSKAPKVRVAVTDKHLKFIDVAAKKLGIDCGYKTRSKALEVILDCLLSSNYPRVLRVEHWAD